MCSQTTVEVRTANGARARRGFLSESVLMTAVKKKSTQFNEKNIWVVRYWHVGFHWNLVLGIWVIWIPQYQGECLLKLPPYWESQHCGSYWGSYFTGNFWRNGGSIDLPDSIAYNAAKAFW